MGARRQRNPRPAPTDYNIRLPAQSVVQLQNRSADPQGPGEQLTAKAIWKRQERERLARRKAVNQKVYISGLQGQHSLEVGVAYYYRGHFIYAPSRNPIEPVPFSTRTGIQIVGTRAELAPRYEADGKSLVSELTISALNKSCHRIWHAQKEEEQQKQQNEDTAKNSDKEIIKQIDLVPSEADLPMWTEISPIVRPSSKQSETRATDIPKLKSTSRPASHTSLSSLVEQITRAPSRASSFPMVAQSYSPSLRSPSYTSLPAVRGAVRASSLPRANIVQPNTTRAPSMPSITVHAPQTAVDGTMYTPHDRALYLADSAPGSRVASAINSPRSPRSLSPALPGLGHGINRGFSLRSVASTSRLSHMLSQSGERRVSSPLSEVLEGNYSYTKTRISTRDSETDSDIESDWIGPHDIDTFIGTVPRSPSPSHPSHKPVGTGRPRGASLALNKAYNAANPPTPCGSKAVVSAVAPECPLHGKECDGVSVSQTWRTRRAIENAGLKEVYPMVMGLGGRQIVDWDQLYKEERGARGI